jgi:hypothetical protein
MVDSRLTLAVAALLTVAALGLAATALETPETAGGGGGVGAGTGGGAGAGGGAGGTTGNSIVLPVLLVLVVLGALGALLSQELRRGGDRFPLVLFVLLVVSLVVVVAFVTLAPGGSNEPRGQPVPVMTPEPAGGGGTGEPTATDVPVTPMATVGLLLALLAVGGLAVRRFTRGTDTGEPDPEPEGPASTAAVGEAAGRGADRLAAGDSNAVYRTWREMTEALDVRSPETTTPADFARVAVEAGLDRNDVETLTDLFREVRYGGAAVTETRERRAREALRNIEAEHAPEEETGE